MSIPKASERPTLPVWPDTARALGISRNLAYAGIKDGSIPSLRLGGRIVVPTAALRRLLGMSDDE